MGMVLFFKAHVGRYTRRDGVVVETHETRAPAAQVRPHAENAIQKVWRPTVEHKTQQVDSYKSVKHPQVDDDGKPVRIHTPSVPSMAPTWSDPRATAVFVPTGETPAELHGIAFAPWIDAPTSIDQWQDVDGQLPDLVEPVMRTHGKKAAAGAVIMEPDGRIWIVCPTNAFGYTEATFPKGRADDGLTLQAVAIKEAFEESGLQIEITGFFGDFERSKTTTRYYRARRVGGTPAAMGWESQAVKLVPQAALHDTLNVAIDQAIANCIGMDHAA